MWVQNENSGNANLYYGVDVYGNYGYIFYGTAEPQWENLTTDGAGGPWFDDISSLNGYWWHQGVHRTGTGSVWATMGGYVVTTDLYLCTIEYPSDIENVY
jgi:hypothetical protein